MTALREFATLEIGINNKVSEGAQAAARDLGQIEAAAEKAQAAATRVEGGLRVLGSSFDAVAARSDALARAEQQRVQIMERAERQTAQLTAAAAREGRSADELAKAIAAVTLRRDADIAKAERQARVQQATLQALAGGASTSATAIQSGAVAIDRFSVANDNAAASTGRLRNALGQAGFQVQDFLVQVQGGQSALLALGQQGSQLLGILGPAGAIAGVALVFGTMAAQILGAKSAADELREALDGQKALLEEVSAAAERYREGLEATGRTINQLADYYRSASDSVRIFDARRAQSSVTNLANQQGAIEEGILGSLRRDINSARGGTAQVDIANGLSFGAATEGLRQLSGGLAQVQGALQEFDRSTASPIERIADLTNRLLSASETAGNFRSSIQAAAQALISATPEIIRVAEAQQQAASAFLATRIGAGDSDEVLQRYVRSMGRIGQEALNAARGIDAVRQAAVGLALATSERQAELDNEVIVARVRGGVRQAQAVSDRQDRDSRVGAERIRLEAAALQEFRAAGSDAATALEELRDQGNRYQVQAERNIGLSRGRAAALRDESAAAGGAARSGAEQNEELIEMARAVQDAERDRQSLEREGASVTASVRTEAEKYAETLGNLNNLLAAGAIDQETFNRASRAADPALRQAEAAARQSVQTANTIETTFAGAFTRAFESGELDGKSFFENIKKGVRSLAATIASQLVFRMAVVPVVNTVGSALGFGSNLLGTPNTPLGGAGLGGLFGGSTSTATGTAGGAAGTSGGGFSLGGIGSISSLGNQVSSLFSGSSLGRFFPGGSDFTGFGSGLLNTQLTSTTGAIPTGVSALTAAEVPGLSVAELAAANGTGAFTSGGLSLGQALGPAAAIGGGIYGIYSGIQKGGIGGLVGGLGGAVSAATGVGLLGSSLGLLPALGALGPIGLIGGAILAIAGSLLPGQKPSGKGQSSIINLASNEERFNGLTGNRFSQANQDEASKFANSVANLEDTLAKALGFGLGSEVGAGVTSGRKKDDPGQLYLRIGDQEAQFARDEAGAKAFGEKAAEFLLNEFQKNASSAPDANIASILGKSADVTALQANLTWYETTYKALVGTAEKTSEFAESLRSLVKPYDDAIGKATDLGLATEIITAKRGEALEKALAPLLGTVQVTDAYADGVKAIEESYKAVIKVAGDLGRSTTDLTAAMGKAVDKFRAETQKGFDSAVRSARGEGFVDQLLAVRDNFTTNAQTYLSAGRDPNVLYAAQISSIINQLDVPALETAIKALDGIDNVAVLFAETRKAQLTAAAAADAQKQAADVQKQAADATKEALKAAVQQGGSIRSWVDSQRSTGSSGASIPDQFAAAQDQFGRDLALARNSDPEALARITGTADRLLAAGQGMFASSPEFQALRGFVLSSLETLPATKGYDQLVLEELRKLGGRVDVQVGIEVVRVISETLNTLSDADRERLVQTQVVLRTVEERLGALLTPADLDQLVQGQVVLRSIEQALVRNLSPAEQAALVGAGTVFRAIEQALTRPLTDGERMLLLASGVDARSVEQSLGRALTDAERGALVVGGDVLRSISQAIGRDLSGQERSALVTGALVERVVTQALGRDLTPGERDALVQSASVVRQVEQVLGRSLTLDERALIYLPGEVTRTIAQDVNNPIGAALIGPGAVDRFVRQTVETSETIQISRSIDEKLGTILQDMNLQLIAANTNIALTNRYAAATAFNTAVALNGDYSSRGWGGAPGIAIAGSYEDGGIVANGQFGIDSVYAKLAGGEMIVPAAEVASNLAAVRSVNAGGGGGGELLAEMRAMRSEMTSMRRELATLRAERSAADQKVIPAVQRTAAATEDAAATNAAMARADNVVALRPRPPR